MLDQPHTVLIVDDEQTSLRLLERVLHRHFRVIAASSGEEALVILQREEISVLISDQRMPGMLGTELLRKSQAIDPDVVCMLITGANDAGTLIEALTHSGAIRVINKPWDPDKVIQAVKDAIEKHENIVRQKQSIRLLKQANIILDRIAKPE